mmetsp:Transcript_6140/g.15701  ORF Transcript_6140/g.15701 Transcript_6140/m.15701 type:complete len:222 (+) Transcript_6140:407-1072(+)
MDRPRTPSLWITCTSGRRRWTPALCPRGGSRWSPRMAGLTLWTTRPKSRTGPTLARILSRGRTGRSCTMTTTSCTLLITMRSRRMPSCRGTSTAGPRGGRPRQHRHPKGRPCRTPRPCFRRPTHRTTSTPPRRTTRTADQGRPSFHPERTRECRRLLHRNPRCSRLRPPPPPCWPETRWVWCTADPMSSTPIQTRDTSSCTTTALHAIARRGLASPCSRGG